MAKKKPQRKKPVKKKAAPRKSSRKISPAKKSKKKKSAARPKPVKKQAAKKQPVKKRTAASKSKRVKNRIKKKPATLGRPKLTGDALLDQVFKEDFHARQIFTFLRATTLKELERHSPEEIIDRLSAPLVQTVQQIRKRLADHNRHLAGDLEYALRRKQQRTGK